MLDARGLLCPMPAAMTQKEIKKNSPEELSVLVDDPCAVGNITRLGNNNGYDVFAEKGADGEWTLTLKKR